MEPSKIKKIKKFKKLISSFGMVSYLKELPADYFEHVLPDEYNTRKIPRAEYIENIDNFVKQHGGDAAAAITVLQEKLQKYSFMLDVIQKQKNALVGSSADLQENLDLIDYLEKQEDAFETRYELAAGVYAKAIIPKSDKVSLWLGSHVMVEFPCGEARSLLRKNLDDAEQSIVEMAKNLQFIKEQITMVEVSISRVFNWDVQRIKTPADVIE